MAVTPIRILRAVRRRSVEEARHALGACLTAEAQAVDAVQAIVERRGATGRHTRRLGDRISLGDVPRDVLE